LVVVVVEQLVAIQLLPDEAATVVQVCTGMLVLVPVTHSVVIQLLPAEAPT
jgi:hypothetical protein